MSVWGIAMMRDEADVAYATIVHMAEEGLEGIIVADNLSVDGTLAELERAAADVAEHTRVVVLQDREPAYYQSDKMTALAGRAAALGADWIVPFDADELWLARDRISFVLGHLPDSAMVATAALYDHYPSAIDPQGDNPFLTIRWRRPDPAPLVKVAFRWQSGVRVLQGNHGVVYPTVTPRQYPALLIRHFPYRTCSQFITKARNGAAAYAATTLPENEGAHWRQYGAILEREGEAGLEAVFRRWFWNLAPVQAGLILDPAPFRRWHTSEPAEPADKEQG